MKNFSSNWKIFSHRRNENGNYVSQNLPNALNLQKKIALTLLCIIALCIGFCAFFPIISVIFYSSVIAIISIFSKIIIIQKTKQNQEKLQENYLLQMQKIEHFPLYTILVPIFMEKKADILNCRQNLAKIKYPNVEILYLIEEIDLVANATFQNIMLNENEKFIKIPRIFPFTKPKACNYGLEFARGKYITIYDIEDSPHPHQLHFAHFMFLNDTNLSCVQFPLEFYESNTIYENWQRLDYIWWYDYMANFVKKHGNILPLGGTSNHFLTQHLRMAGGWDAYNVTEDAELGLRLCYLGYKTAYCQLFSTMEPPVKNLTNLYNQRIRWSKGHLITAIQMGFLFCKRRNLNEFFYFVYVLTSQWVIFLFSILVFSANFFSKNLENDTIILLNCVNILAFLLMPLLYFALIKKVRTKKMIFAVLTYNIFYIFYFFILSKALLEGVFRPFKWYKTIR